MKKGRWVKRIEARRLLQGIKREKIRGNEINWRKDVLQTKELRKKGRKRINEMEIRKNKSRKLSKREREETWRIEANEGKKTRIKWKEMKEKDQIRREKEINQLRWCDRLP